MIYYVSGGERSGKSRYAQNLAESISQQPIYIATARIWDANFQDRVNRHIGDRNQNWTTLEEEKYLSKLNITDRTVVLDCVTLWLTNWFLDLENDVEQCLIQAQQEFDLFCKQEANIIIVSNEIGMGLHAQTEIGRKFTELQGWMNQYIAKKADCATFMVSGLPLKLK